MTFLEASRAWIEATGDLPLNVTILFEGEEESGSPSLNPFLKANRKELSCDLALVCDTNMWDERTPAITTRLRGMMHDEVIITGPAVDLHSGLYGGAAMNPIRVLTRILADMHNRNGKVMIPDFYDGVTEAPKKTREQWDRLKMTAHKFLGPVGLKLPAGESRRTVLEQVWTRPTADVNGIIGGYTGEGTKTVIPSRASAKISFRLVGDQDPVKIRKNFRNFVKERVPADCKVEFSSTRGGSPAIEFDETSPYMLTAAKALKQEFGREPVMMGCGGSIPIVQSFKNILGMDSMLVGFGLNDDAIHSPNEKYNISSLHRGTRSWARIIGSLAEQE
jgi:acetylornithine deacetylase/succinyl-diaminopimelate desuccinylase-like protein